MDIKNQLNYMRTKLVLKYKYHFLYRLAAKVKDTSTEIFNYFDPNYKKEKALLSKLKNKYKGERCFIIGNGPSLNKTELKLLEGEYTFGLNRIYLLFDELRFETTFLVSINDLVIQQCAEEFTQLKKTLPFLNRSCKDKINTQNNHYLQVFSSPVFSKDITKGVWDGATVTFVAMQLAYYMGFTKVILIGVDHNFTTKGPARSEVVFKGEDPNHFCPDYFGKGFRWLLPDLETSEHAYKLARRAFKEKGAEIVDATIGGELEVFPKVEYSELF